MGIRALGRLDDRRATVNRAHGRWERGGVAGLLGTEPKINARGPGGVFGGVPISFDVCWVRPVS